MWSCLLDFWMKFFFVEKLAILVFLLLLLLYFLLLMNLVLAQKLMLLLISLNANGFDFILRITCWIIITHCNKHDACINTLKIPSNEAFLSLRKIKFFSSHLHLKTSAVVNVFAKIFIIIFTTMGRVCVSLHNFSDFPYTN